MQLGLFLGWMENTPNKPAFLVAEDPRNKAP